MKKPAAIFVKGIVGADPILTDGVPQIALVGRSNVGKSSLINTLSGMKDLAREGKKPGKTREINLYSLQNRLYLVDLPGYGFAEASLKDRAELKDLIIWYLTTSGAHIAHVVLMLDAVAGLTALDRDMLMILQNENLPFVVVLNKIDKLSQKDIHTQVKKIQEIIGEQKMFLCSAREAKGIDVLREYVFSNANLL